MRRHNRVRAAGLVLAIGASAVAGPSTATAQVIAKGPAMPRCHEQVALAGAVLTLDSLPVPGLRVAVDARQAETRTGNDGRFELRCLGAPGDVAVTVTGDGYEPLTFTLKAPAVATVSVSLTMRETFPAPTGVASGVPAAPTLPVPSPSLASRSLASPLPALASPAPREGGTPSPVAAGPVVVGPRDRGGATPGSGFIRGIVRDDAGQPLRGVRLELMGSPVSVMTDPEGRFAFPNVPFGPYLVRVRRIGFEPQLFTLRVGSTETNDLDVRLSKATGLDTVKVIAKDPRADRLRGFYSRKASITTSGHFIEEEEIRNRKPFNTSDILRGRAGLLVSRDNQGQTVVFGRNMHIVGGWCPLALFVDGVPFNRIDGYIDRFVPVDNVKAIEVYPSAVSLPTEFQRQMSGCGAVVVWTK